jgi:hypothetical protein
VIRFPFNAGNRYGIERDERWPAEMQSGPIPLDRVRKSAFGFSKIPDTADEQKRNRDE